MTATQILQYSLQATPIVAMVIGLYFALVRRMDKTDLTLEHITDAIQKVEDKLAKTDAKVDKLSEANTELRENDAYQRGLSAGNGLHVTHKSRTHTK